MAKQEKNREFKRLFFDIETTPNLVFSWNVGRKINIDYDNIVKERAIICIGYKWENEQKVHSLTWDKKGDDKKMLAEFVKVMEEADEIIGHNSDQFDIKWVRTRCLYHNVPIAPDFTTIDTLKLSKKGFRFNSNRLDYISKFLKIGKKTETGGLSLWKGVINGDEPSLKKMVDYCKNDVVLLEDVFKRLNPYVKHRTHIGVFMGNTKHSCPECGSTQMKKQGTKITATGYRKQQLQCTNCGKYHTINVK